MKINLSTKEERKEYLERLIKNYEEFEACMRRNKDILKILLENDHVDEIIIILSKTSDKLINIIEYHDKQINLLVNSGKTAIGFNKLH